MSAFVGMYETHGLKPAAEFIGRSFLHNSVARGLHRDARSLSILTASVPACSAIATLYAESIDFSIATRTEPTIVHGITQHWRGADAFNSRENLLAHFGSVRFELAGDVSMTLEQYAQYAAQTTVDFPYYIYEREYVGECQRTILDSYVSPSWIQEDLLELAPDLAPRKCTPAFLLGGPRTGSQLHVDSLCTCGWNVCCFGRKRW